MKTLTIILLATLMSCSPFISKDLREKNRCNRRLARVTKSCPGLLKQDTIKDTVYFHIPKVEIDTFIQLKTDTTILEIIKNDTIRKFLRKFITTYIPFEDTIRHKIRGYTFLFWFTSGKLHYSVNKPLEVIKTINKIPVKIVRPIKLTFREKIMNLLARFWLWIVIVIALIFGFKTITKF